MPTDEEKFEERERALSEERAKAARLKTQIDAEDEALNPPKPAIDHASDGGVI
jgi:hypothetical protein